MKRRIGVVASVIAAAAVLQPAAVTRAAPRLSVTRLRQNPLITVTTSPSPGDDINGPTVIRVPPWIDHPLGRYYMYFAHHMGAYIRLAYADRIEGPWKVYEPGVLHVRDSAFYRPQPDPVENLEHFYTHVASPEIYVDGEHRRLVMWFHGWWTDGEMWPVGEPAARRWARAHGYAQFTQSAHSSDGLHFEIHPAISKESYLRVFPEDGIFYAIARLGRLMRSRDPFGRFDIGPNPFRETAYAGRVRHVARLRRGTTLAVFFTGIGDAPERILRSTIDLVGDWTTWKASQPIDVLAPEASYECPELAATPSEPGDVKGPARQLRDPAIFEEDRRTFLFYSICGEQGIAASEVHER